MLLFRVFISFWFFFYLKNYFHVEFSSLKLVVFSIKEYTLREIELLDMYLKILISFETEDLKNCPKILVPLRKW